MQQRCTRRCFSSIAHETRRLNRPDTILPPVSAVHNGQRAAQAAAEAAGSQLGAVKEINISGTSPSYSRVYGAAMSLRAVNKMEADSTPVEAGTNTLSQSVSLTYYLQ